MLYSHDTSDDFDLADLITQTDGSGKPSSVRPPRVKSPRNKQGKRFKGAATRAAPSPRSSKVAPNIRASANEVTTTTTTKTTKSRVSNKQVSPITEVSSEDSKSITSASSFVEGFQSLCCSYSLPPEDVPRDRPLVRRESRRHLGVVSEDSVASKRVSNSRRESSKRQGRKPVIPEEAPVSVTPEPVSSSQSVSRREKSRQKTEFDNGEETFPQSFEEIPEDVFDGEGEGDCHDEEDYGGFLLPPKNPKYAKKKTLVLDLDETLVHSSFKAVPWADFAIPVQVGEQSHFVYVTKRPGVDEFLTEMAKYYEIVVYTASRDKYADPLLDILDERKVIQKRLYREHCLFNEGTYVKDLSRLGRDLKETIIVDNAPHSYVFHPDNAIDCTSFIDDNMDRELYQIGGFLKSIRNVKDVRDHCSEWKDFANPMAAARSPATTNDRFSGRGEGSALFV